MIEEKEGKEFQGDAPEGNTKRDTVGAFAWLTQFVESLRSGDVVSVPCGECNACCSAFDAVRTSDGGMLLSGPDGSCSELRCGKCSIYSDRPPTCRYYDCRTHLFSGVDPVNPTISDALKGWRVPTYTPEDAAVVAIIRTIAAVISNGGQPPEIVAVQACILAYDRIHKPTSRSHL